MIRTMQYGDVEELLQIWLDGNQRAHAFIPASYWHGHLAMMRDALPQAQVTVYEDAAGIQGFLGRKDAYIAGLFIRQTAEGRGIGRALLDFAKAHSPQLSLHVYVDNVRAVEFYTKAGFRVQQTQTDAATGRAEYAMLWKADAAFGD